MFNLKKAKSSKVAPFEKAIEENREDFEDVAKDKTKSYQGELDADRKNKDLEITTEAQMERENSQKSATIVEKNLKREKMGDLYVPSINAFVTKLEQERRKDFVAAQNYKKDHWTLDKPTQNAELPEWPKIPEQHNKESVPNCPGRDVEKPLIGGKILKASVIDAAFAVKEGKTLSYDKKIVDILKIAAEENRELSESEKQEINSIKQARSNSLIKTATREMPRVTLEQLKQWGFYRANEPTNFHTGTTIEEIKDKNLISEEVYNGFKQSGVLTLHDIVIEGELDAENIFLLDWVDTGITSSTFADIIALDKSRKERTSGYGYLMAPLREKTNEQAEEKLKDMGLPVNEYLKRFGK